METFSALLALVRGIQRSPVNSPHKGQWRGAFMFSLIWINGWVKNREAGDVRRHRAHYDVTVMSLAVCNPLGKDKTVSCFISIIWLPRYRYYWYWNGSMIPHCRNGHFIVTKFKYSLHRKLLFWQLYSLWRKYNRIMTFAFHWWHQVGPIYTKSAESCISTH